MRPGKEGTLILEGERDIRYAEIGARLMGNSGLVKALHEQRAQALQDYFYNHIGGVGDTSLAQLRENGVIHSQTNIVQKRATRYPETSRRPVTNLDSLEMPIDAAASPSILEGLQAITEQGKLGALMLGVKRPVAEAMLVDFAQHKIETPQIQIVQATA